MSVNRSLSKAARAAAIVLAAAVLGVFSWAHGATEPDEAASTVLPPAVRTGPSGLPLPRFVSLKSDRVNVRSGPGQDHRVAWTFSRAGLPVEIIAEFENWRRIRDSDGSEGWIFHSLLSGRRTGVVAPWSGEETLPLRRQAGEGGQMAALLEPGVLVDLQECDGAWCRLAVQNVTGYLRQEHLWGVYPREVFE